MRRRRYHLIALVEALALSVLSAIGVSQQSGSGGWSRLVLAAGVSQGVTSSTELNEPAAKALAKRMAEAIDKSKQKAVLVFDFVGSGVNFDDHTQQSLPMVTSLGRSLANDFSEALAQSTSRARVDSWTHVSQSIGSENHFFGVANDPTTAWWMAKTLNFNLFVWGALQRQAEGKLKVSVTCYRTSNGTPVKGLEVLADLSPEARDMANVEIHETFFANYPKGGRDGYTLPTCRYCPEANYSDDAASRKFEGTVEIETIITADGRAKGIKILRALPYGLTEQAIKAVQEWEFVPASGPSGKPAAVRQIIDVSFHLWTTAH